MVRGTAIEKTVRSVAGAHPVPITPFIPHHRGTSEPMSLQYDRSVRAILRHMLTQAVADDLDAFIIDEMPVCEGIARIDMAVVNGALHGYEIKSDGDSLRRLGTQAQYYSESLDYVTLAMTQKHIEAALATIPSWWGIIAMKCESSGVALTQVRVALPNPEINVMSFTEFLRREEAYTILEVNGIGKGYKSANRERLRRRLAETMAWPDLHAAILKAMKSRESWALLDRHT